MSAPDSAAEPTGVFRTILQSFRGEHHDYTAAPLQRAVILLAVPMVLEMVMESLFAVVDIFWVSHLGARAIAAVGLTESVMSLIYALAIGISIAATAIVARRIGEKAPAEAARAAGQIILLALACAGAIGLALAFAAPHILGLMGADAPTTAIGGSFARIMLGGNVTVFLIFVINAIFRGVGDPVLAMRTLWLANGLNLILDPCFIFGWGPFPELGLAGAAVATNCGRALGVLYQLWHLTGTHGRLRLHLAHFRPDAKLLRTILGTARNGIAQLLINTTSWIGLFKILAYFGSSALAGYTIAIRVVIFALMPAWGLANAGATLVGQNLGAQKPDRAEAAVRLAARFNMIFLGATGLLFVLAASFIARLFTTDPDVLRYATRALWIVSLGFPFYAAGMCFEAAFNGAGDTWTPTRLNFFFFWLGQVPLAWILARPLGLGPLGVFIAVPVSFSALALTTWLLFRRGHWKRQKV
ncbi:MATE family efflux transporter [Horticoccus luteus]|uniref:Multidrug-efflux transporter n=1 Tax=Horticoccus luteus TaxID=2862869 RepID=A0A8F9XGB5_9BACT|nr:MATE family efflux transporter [Horticoccus luteus]QYM78997.1 MATE family efflux transporter [Horticoccus luteus]